jgi:hypothetical protein
MKSPLVLLIFTVLLFPVAADADTWLVRQDGSGDAPTIQAGIDSASAGDVVLVGCGTYYEHDIHMKSGVHLRGESLLEPCVTVDAEWNGRAFYCVRLDEMTKIEGLIITHGNGEGPQNCFQPCGGGMYVQYSSLTIENCTFVDNRAWGVYYDQGLGGGLVCLDSSPRIVGCTFSDNSAGVGGGMYCNESSPAIEDCIFADNGSTGLLSKASSLSLIRALFVRNHGDHTGGLVLSSPGSAIVNHCTFVANWSWAEDAGAGITLAFPERFDELTIVNTIIAFSTEGRAVAVPYGDPSSIMFVSCNAYGNAGGDWVGEVAEHGFRNCNFSSDPLFCDAAEDDYTLMDTSPCAPGYHPQGCTFGLIGALPVACTDTDVEAVTWGRIKVLFR